MNKPLLNISEAIAKGSLTNNLPNMGRNYVLENNRKPATHFFEVFRNNVFLTNQQDLKENDLISKPKSIDQLIDELKYTERNKLKTIAIFKIRMK